MADELARELSRGAQLLIAEAFERRIAKIESIKASLAAAGRMAGADAAELRKAGAALDDMDLRGLNLAGRDLRNIPMRRVRLEGANLSGAILDGADLEGASLRRAEFNGASLKRADLRQADLRQARGTAADLAGAALDGARLEGARLQGASLLGASARQTAWSGARVAWMNIEAGDFGGSQGWGSTSGHCVGACKGGPGADRPPRPQDPQRTMPAPPIAPAR